MSKKTIDNWHYEQFAKTKLESLKNCQSKEYIKLVFKRSDDGAYVVPHVQFGFECWMESKRIQKDLGVG